VTTRAPRYGRNRLINGIAAKSRDPDCSRVTIDSGHAMQQTLDPNRVFSSLRASTRLIELVLDEYRPVSGILFRFRSIERDVESGEPFTVGLTFWAEANVPISGDPYAMPATCR
jgi:hypothetical protein